MKKMEDEIMNDPEVKKAMGEAMQEFANLENEVMQAMQSPEGQAAAAQLEADMKFVAQVLEEAGAKLEARFGWTDNFLSLSQAHCLDILR